jgi:hypothetical protein
MAIQCWFAIVDGQARSFGATSRDALIEQIVDKYADTDFEFNCPDIVMVGYSNDGEDETIYDKRETDDFQNTIEFELLKAKRDYYSEDYV